MSAAGNGGRASFPNADALCELLKMLKPKHDPVIRQFCPQVRTPRFVQTLRQSERVIESGSNVGQKALCSFHIGLYYLHWRENVGAAHRFERAGRYWQITPLPPLVCLASLAESIAWYQACDNEAALVATIQAERQLGRLANTVRGPNPTGKLTQVRNYVEHLKAVLEQTQATLQQSLDDESDTGIAPPTTNMEDD